MVVRINSWEDGMNEGVFDTLEEAKTYVVEEELDVVITLPTGFSYRYNLDIHQKVLELQANEKEWKTLGTVASKAEMEEGK